MLTGGKITVFSRLKGTFEWNIAFGLADIDDGHHFQKGPTIEVSHH